MSLISFQDLKNRQRKERESYSDNLRLRIHRALSWLNKAEQSRDDLDAMYIFLWISFNAAYANDIEYDLRKSEKETFQNFLNRLCDLDGSKKIEKIVWRMFPKNIRTLLSNKFVFQPFWDFQNKMITEPDWKEKFQIANNSATRALGKKDTAKVLSIVFSRLYTLRNQLLHGGATWNSSVNREQMRDAVMLLGELTPVIIEIMMDNHNEIWGDACYPVVE